MDQFERGTLKLVLSAGINYKLAVAWAGRWCGAGSLAAGAGHVDSVWAAGGWWQGNT